MNTDTEVCIVGAGPAGTSLSHFLSNKRIPHYLVDKTSFPRDKVCGDGVTVDVMNTLKRMGPDMLGDFLEHADMEPSWGFCFRAPNGKPIRFDFKEAGFPYAPFYTAKRLNLDNYLLNKVNTSYCTFLPETKVSGLERSSKGVEVKLETQSGKSSLNAKIVVGAEGEKPIVTRHLGLDHYREKKHLIGALRVYYKNVKGFHPNNHLEFFFDKKLMPGYFWAFPLPNNEANVGLGMVSTAISADKVNLKRKLENILQTHPLISEMFSEAEPLEKPKGWGLPTITSNRLIAGERYALIGDAGGMIEPFTGKGIGPGMVSGRICADHIESALKSGNFDMIDYHYHMYRYYKNEIKVGYGLQKSLQNTTLLNTAIGLFNLAPLKNWSNRKMVKSWIQWM